MADISQNTVSSQNQMNGAPDKCMIGNESAPYRILILGNSILRHGVNAAIGWNYCWGMAASAEENDFVHVFTRMMTEAGKDVYVMARQVSTFERGYLEENILDRFADAKEFGADLIIVRFGENVRDVETPEQQKIYEKSVLAFLDYLKKEGTEFIFTNDFWKKEKIDECSLRMATETGSPFVSLSHLGSMDEMMAIGKFEHSGVSIHPGDLGMKTIAELLFAEAVKLVR